MIASMRVNGFGIWVHTYTLMALLAVSIAVRPSEFDEIAVTGNGHLIKSHNATHSDSLTQLYANNTRVPVPMWHALAYGTYQGLGPPGAVEIPPHAIPASPDSLAQLTTNSSMGVGTGTAAFLVWFKGLRKGNAPAATDATCWLGELIDYDPFLFAGHFAVAGSNKCTPTGFGPVIGNMKGSVALQQAKDHVQWAGAWTDDTTHFKDACKYGAKVHYKAVDCGAGSFPGPAGTIAGLTYGFPCEGDTKWLKTTFNCATMPTALKKVSAGACQFPKTLMSCMASGQIRDCDDSGSDWCKDCNR